MTGKLPRRHHSDAFHLFVVMSVIAIVCLCVVGVRAEQVAAR